MPLLESERERFLAIKAREEAKGKVLIKREPSKFRETAQDTHKISPAEDWGPPGIGISTISSLRQSPTLTNNSGRFLPPKPITSMHALWADSNAVLYPKSLANQQNQLRSVFEPSPDQREACLPEVQRRANKASSEWALLDTFQVKMTMDEHLASEEKRRERQRIQKANLDIQVRDKRVMSQKLRHDKVIARLEVDAAHTQHHLEFARQQEETRCREREFLEHRGKTATEVKTAAEQARLAQKRLEDEMLARTAEQMEKEKEEVTHRRQQRQEEAMQAMSVDAARASERRAERAVQKARDAVIVQKLVDKMDEQEELRMSVRMQRMDAADQRAATSSGKLLVAERQAKLAEEERRCKREAEHRRLKDALAEAEAATKHEREAREIALDRQRAILAKRNQQRVQVDQIRQDKEDVEAKVEAEARLEADKLNNRRRRSEATQSIVRVQMDQRGNRGQVAGVFMEPRELEVNRRMLEAAAATIGQPFQINNKLF